MPAAKLYARSRALLLIDFRDGEPALVPECCNSASSHLHPHDPKKKGRRKAGPSQSYATLDLHIVGTFAMFGDVEAFAFAHLGDTQTKHSLDG